MSTPRRRSGPPAQPPRPLCGSIAHISCALTLTPGHTFLKGVSAVTIEAIERRGLINKFLGDGFMAVFGAPSTIRPVWRDARTIYFTLPAVRPPTRWRSIRAKSTTTGTMAMTEAAKSWFQC